MKGNCRMMVMCDKIVLFIFMTLIRQVKLIMIRAKGTISVWKQQIDIKMDRQIIKRKG